MASKETFTGFAWYGIGFNNASNMALADYNIVFPSGNFTGVMGSRTA